MPTTVMPHLARRSDLLRSSAIRDLLHLAERPDVLSLAGGLPDGSSLPVDRIARACVRALGASGRYGPTALQYGPTEGIAALREFFANGSAAHPALGTPDEIVVTTGSQQGLELLARVLLDPGDTVVVDDPVYLGARQVFEANGARLVGVPVDRDGLDVEMLDQRLAAGLRPRLVYTVPHFQNPTGAVLSEPRRAQLGALAERYGFVVIEDDPYGALGFDGSRGTPVGLLAPDHTATLGSTSKVLAPGLRVGWVRAPMWLHPALVRAKQSLDLHTAALPQLIALDVLTDANFVTAHLAALRGIYASRAAALATALAGCVDVASARGGMFLWGETPVDTETAFGPALAAGVAYIPGAAFAVDRDGSHAVRLSYATLAEPDLAEAARRLRAAFACVD